MRIATLSNAAVVHTRRWVDHFRARGHDVRLFSLEPPPPGLVADRLPRAALPGLLRYPLALPALRRALAEFRPDVVDAHFVPNYGLLGALAGRRPLAVSAWGSDLLVSGRRDALRRARVGWVMRRADLVLADAENLGEAARALGAPRERVRVIPWGVDRARFHPASERDPGLLLSTRMHEPIYDLPVILAGVAPVLERHPHTRLVVTGDGSQYLALRREAERVLPPGRCTFLGRIDPGELAGWLGRAELYLSASRSDSTSLSLLEAMSAGALPVVSDLAGNREWVTDGEGARCFPVGDAAALTRALETALGDPAWAAAARARNASVIEARGDWTRNLARIESLFADLAAGRALGEAP